MQDQNHTNWSVSDFERYHSGKMTEAERHDLEKAALDDPFLEDALDGYAYTQTPVADIAAIKEQLWPVAGEVKTPVIWYKQKAISQLFKAAAILIILGGLGWLIFNNNTKEELSKDTQPIAANQQPGTAEKEEQPVFDIKMDSVPAIAKLDGPPATDAKGSIGQLPPAIPDKDITAYNRNIPAEADDMARNDAKAKDQASFRLNPAAAKRNAPLPGVTSKPTAEEENSFLTDQATANNQNQVRGRVVDQNGQPVPFATIKNNADSRQVTNADVQGNFALQNNNAAASNNLPVEINAVGYDKKQTNLNNASTNTIVLNQQENALAEVAVSKGVSAKAKKESYQWNGKNSLIRLRNATPLEGWDYFYYVMNDSIVKNHYFNKNKGRIILQFDTDTNGIVKNIIVKKSLNDAADKAAMRILQKSPVLKINDRKNKPEAIIKFGY